MTITADDITVSPVAVIRVKDATLNVQGKLSCGRLIIYDGAKLNLSNVGEIVITNKYLDIQEGAILEIQSNGSINILTD